MPGNSNGAAETLKALNAPIEPAPEALADPLLRSRTDDQLRPTLSRLNFTVQMGELVAVVGAVGSGKSSLALALLGEVPRVDGTFSTYGRVAYASQSAWILSGTVRNNILFGMPFDRVRYDRIVRACALDRDFANFPDGDATAIGERGVTLSGGQRARISLARALYFDADVYLLDDPLSAVDARVSRILFDQAIRGMEQIFLQLLQAPHAL